MQRYTDEDIRAMRRGLAGGVSQQDVADAFGCCVRHVGRVARREVRRDAGGPVVAVRWRTTEDERADIRELHTEGLSIREIAARLGLPRTTVHRWCGGKRERSV